MVLNATFNNISVISTYTRSSIFSTNKTDCHDITEILLKVALSTIKAGTHVKICFIRLACCCMGRRRRFMEYIGGKLKRFYSYLDLPFSAVLVRHDGFKLHVYLLWYRCRCVAPKLIILIG
jgi:hypothetical protein